MANVNAITSSNPGRNGVFFRAPLGAKLPVTATEDLDGAFEDQGIVGEEGVQQTITRDSDDVKSYGGDTVYTLQTDYGQEIVTTVYESTSVPTLRTAFGDDNVTKTAEGIKVLHNKSRLPRSSMVWDHLIDQGVKRQVAEQAQVIGVGDIANVHTDIVKYELTSKLYPDAEGNLLTEYIALMNGEGPLQIASSMIVDGDVGQDYSARVIAAGGTAPYAFAVVGSLPAGLTLDAESGVISGQPEAAGDNEITIRVTDAKEAEVQKTLSLTIRPEAEAAEGND